MLAKILLRRVSMKPKPRSSGVKSKYHTSGARYNLKLTPHQGGRFAARCGEGLQAPFTLRKVQETMPALHPRHEHAGVRRIRDYRACSSPSSRPITYLSKQVNTELKKSSEESIKESLQELADWESELKRLQTLAPIAAERDRLKNVEIPSLETQIREKEGELPEATKSAEDVSTLRHMWPLITDCGIGSCATQRGQERSQGYRRTQGSGRLRLADPGRASKAPARNIWHRDGPSVNWFHQDSGGRSSRTRCYIERSVRNLSRV